MGRHSKLFGVCMTSGWNKSDSVLSLTANRVVLVDNNDDRFMSVIFSLLHKIPGSVAHHRRDVRMGIELSVMQNMLSNDYDSVFLAMFCSRLRGDAGLTASFVVHFDSAVPVDETTVFVSRAEKTRMSAVNMRLI